MELSTFSTLNFPLFQKGVIKKVPNAAPTYDKKVLTITLCLALPVARAELKLGHKAHKNILPIKA